MLSRHSFLMSTGKEKALADLEDDETEEEFESGDELEKEEEEGWGEREFVSDDSELEDLQEDGDAWDLENMGLERASDDDDGDDTGAVRTTSTNVFSSSV